MKIIRLSICVFLFFWMYSCDKKESGNSIDHSGYIYMACDFGPYYLQLDSLILHCSEAGLLDNDLVLDSIGQENSCLYDGNEGLLGSLENHDFIFTRDSLTINTDDFSQVEIDIMLDGQLLTKGEYPYYHGYNLNFDNSEVNIYMINKFIGGCFHDMILFEIMR